MIVAENARPELSEFRSLMARVDAFLNEEAKTNNEIRNSSGGRSLEPIVRDAAQECAKGTPFEGKIKLFSGGRFPDIVAARFYGIEVKSTNKDHWTSIGSSILESTRIEDVDRIFLTFGKLGDPIEFRSRPYEECLSGIAVTHYPRYQIDMTLKSGETIFDKMGIAYEDLRKMDDPVPPVAEYYKSQLKPGQSLWWASNVNETAAPATVRTWTALSPGEKHYYEACAYAYFPNSLLSNSIYKYSDMALWLATQCGVVHTSVRDSYSAGGQVEQKDEAGIIHLMPRIFQNVSDHIDTLVSILQVTPPEDLRGFWGEPIEKNRILQWVRLVIQEEVPSKKDVSKSVLIRILKDNHVI